MTAIRSAIIRTTDRSWLMKSSPAPDSTVSDRISPATCAWAEASSAEIGSSPISREGRAARARAMAMRCRCPPENSCG